MMAFFNHWVLDCPHCISQVRHYKKAWNQFQLTAAADRGYTLGSYDRAFVVLLVMSLLTLSMIWALHDRFAERI